MKKDTFFGKKGTKNPPLFNFFLSILHQNKVLHDSHKRVQRSIVKHNTALEYVWLGIQAAFKLGHIKQILN